MIQTYYELERENKRKRVVALFYAAGGISMVVAGFTVSTFVGLMFVALCMFGTGTLIWEYCWR